LVIFEQYDGAAHAFLVLISKLSYFPLIRNTPIM
jgi:hypothetical protein